MRLHRAVDSILHRLAQKAFPELLLEQLHRHLALAEALHLDIGLGLGQFLVDLGVKLVGGDGDLVAALEAFVQGLGDLHFIFLCFLWCVGRDLNPFSPSAYSKNPRFSSYMRRFGLPRGSRPARYRSNRDWKRPGVR